MANDQIKKADDGTYYFRANLGTDPSTGKRVQRYRSGFKTKREAREAYARVVLLSTPDRMEEGRRRVRFGKFIEETYLPWYRTQVKPSTFKNREVTIRKHFAYFYERYTDAIDPIDVQNWQLILTGGGYSPNYVRVVQTMLSTAFDRAVILGIAEKNPSRMVGNVRGKKPDVSFWTLEEFERVLSMLYKGDYYEHYLYICLLLLFMSGMRLGEASALSWDDIDLGTGLCSITKTLDYRNMDEWYLTEPKTRAAKRSIYLDADTVRELSEWKRSQQAVLGECGFVLSYNGVPTTKTRLPRALEKLALLAGVHRIRVHDLRHSHASLLIHMGESPLLLKERLGHEKIQTTLGTYGHLYPNTNLEVAKKLTGILHVAQRTESAANYTSNQHTAAFHIEERSQTAPDRAR